MAGSFHSGGVSFLVGFADRVHQARIAFPKNVDQFGEQRVIIVNAGQKLVDIDRGVRGSRRFDGG